MASDDDDAPSSSTNPAITYTRRRKTKTAASSTRRRHNLSLTQSSYGGNSTDAGNNDKSNWFSRKASGWTDDEIRSHLVTGGASNGGGALSMEGDLIQGSIINDYGDKKRRRKKEKRSRRLGPRFAWEEQEEDDGDDQDDEERNNYYGPSKSDIQKSNSQFTMRAAPTLHDIMDEQDEVDLLAPQQVGNEFQSQPGIVVNNNQSPAITRPNNDRRNNAALAEIAQLYNNDGGSVASGWRLLRVLGYRSRLGMAFVSLPGYATGKGDNNDYANDLESMQQQGMATMNLSSKLLASKGLRAIHLPSITAAQNKSPNNADSSCGNKEMLIIPPPKINKHGIGYDPFKNAPEFRAFHEQRQALAQKRGRAADKNESRSTAYFTDSLQRDERQSLWDKNRDNGNNGNDDDGNESSHREREGTNQQINNHAARDYSDFIGTKASSGFALEDEDDTNVYQDDGGDGIGSNMGKYNLEIHSPVASDDEIDGSRNGLFDSSVASSSIKRKSREGERSVADAWDAWGLGGGTSSASAVTSDGKPALPGFQLESRHQNNDNRQTKRWAGPMIPSGYVLKRHVFQSEQGFKTAAAAYSVDNTDIGLGLDLQSRRQQRPSRSSVPKILPHSDQAQQQSQMRTRNGSELNFNAVKESMKNRFVSCSGDTAPLKSDDVVRGENERDAKDKEEWITVTSSIWVPSRLLCKRWGVPFPSTSGAVVVTQATASTKERVYTGEEAYFNETVLSKQNQHNSNERSGGHSMGVESKNREDVVFTTEMVEEDTPPPTRPSDDLFRSIFDDAGSDMEISSSDEDDDDEEEKQKANEVLGESKAGESETKITTPLDVVAGSRASPFAESDDSHEQTRKHRRGDKRKHRRRSPSTSPDSRDGYDRHYDDHDKRRKKKKKKRHKRSSRQKRH
jgi:G patch domain-containing protein 1